MDPDQRAARAAASGASASPPTRPRRAAAATGSSRTSRRTSAASTASSPLRWFALRDAVALCEGAGLVVEHVERRRRLLWRGTRLDRYALALAPFTFQHVIAARRMPRP